MKNTKLNKRFNNKSNKKYTNKNVSKNKIGKNKTKKYNGIGGSRGSSGNPITVRFSNPGKNTYGSRKVRVLEQGQSLGQQQPFNNSVYNSVYNLEYNRGNRPFIDENLERIPVELQSQLQQLRKPLRQPLLQPQQEYAQSFNNPIYGRSHQTYGNRTNIREPASRQPPRREPASRQPASRELAVRPNKGKKTSPEDRQLVIARNKKISDIDSKYNKSIADLKKNIDINVSTLKQNQSVDIYKETLDNMSNLQSLKEYLENKRSKEINNPESIYSELNEDIKNLKEINNSKIKYITEQTKNINTVVPLANKNDKTKILEYLKILLAKHKMFTDYLNFKLQNSEDFNEDDFREYIKPIIDEQKASLLGNPLKDEKEKLVKLKAYIDSLISLSNKNLIPLADNLKLVSKYIKLIEKIIENFGNKKTFRKEVKTGDELNINNFTGEDFKSKITEARAAKKKQAVETDKQKKEEAENEKLRLLTIRQDKTKGNYIDNNGNVKSIDEIIDHIKSQATKMDINNNKNTGFKTKYKYSTYFLDVTKFTKIKKTINNEKDEVKKNIVDETMRKQIIDILTDIFKRTILTEEIIKLNKTSYNMTEIFENIKHMNSEELEESLQKAKTALEQTEKENKTPQILKLYEEGEEEEGEEDKLITYLKGKANEMLSSNIIRNKNRKPISFLSEKPFDIIKKTINNEISEITTFNKKETAIKLQLSDIFARIVIFKKIYKLTNNNPPNITIDEIFDEIKKFTINTLQIKLSDAEAAAAAREAAAAEAAKAAKAAAEVLEKKPGLFSRAITKLKKLTRKRSASISSPPPLSSEIIKPINHYWYEGWVDHSGPFNKVKYTDGTIGYFPDEIEKFKKFVYMLINDIKGNPGGTVIHCSAGVGRTGTLSVILSIELNGRQEFDLQGDNNGKANYIVAKIIEFRKSRIYFVQDPAQLEFIYQYFELYFNEATIKRFFTDIQNKSNIYDNSDGGKLMTTVEINAITNVNCNRYSEILPHKNTKVVLEDYNVPNSGNNITLKIDRLPCRSYINADTVDIGSGVEIIATQCPTTNTAITENTVESFKHMLVQKDVKRIIMLTGKTENGKIKCSDYTGGLLGRDTVEYGNPQNATSKVTLRKLELIVNKNSVTFKLVNTHEPMIISQIESVNNDTVSLQSSESSQNRSSQSRSSESSINSLSLSGDEDEDED